MAYYSQNGSGIDAWAYIYVQLQVTRTDYPTYSHFDLKSVAVSDTGTSGFIRGQVTTNQGGTSWTAVTGWKDVYYNSTTTLAISSFNVDRGASDKTVRCGAYAEGGGTGIYAGGTDYAWLNVTVPKVLAPNAPTGCTATYVSDSQASVSWTNGTTDTDHPRDATLVERRDGSNDWAQVASASGTASGFTDNGISANTQYQYRVRAKNVAGYSAYSTSGSIYTTPAAPASVTLDKTAATTVQVDVTGTWGYSVTYDIESTYDGGSTWASVATSTSLPYSATVNAGTVQFRVRAVRGALASAWALSASLVTICPPLAPTIVQAPANPTAYGDGSTVAWTPNHPDGSTQSAAEVKVTNPGGTSTTYTVSTATSYSFTPNATGTWTAQVRTKGLDPSYGEWSQTVSWGVHNPPAVVITSPATDGTDVVALPLNVAWTVTDPTGVSTQRIIIEGDGQILNRTLAGDVRAVALNASDVALENGQTYTIRLRVMGGSGLVTEQTRIFDVAWLAPTPPVLQITEGEGKSATIDVMDTRHTSSGTVLEASSAMMDSLTIQGLSVQDGTPAPSAPVAIESVESTNLLDHDLWSTVGVYHGTGVFENNGVTITATSNDSYTNKEFPEAARISVSEGDTVYLAWDSEDNISGTCYIFGNGGTSSMASRNNNAYRSVVYNVPAGITYITFRLGVATSGSTIHYRNVRVTKAPSPYMPKDGIGVVSQGRNLFTVTSNSSSTNGVTRSFDHETGVLEWHGTATANNTDLSMPFAKQVFVPAGANVTVSVLDGTATTTNYLPTVFLRNTGGTYFENKMLDAATRSATFTNAGGQVIEGVLFRANTNYGAVDISSRVMMEVGSTATPYQPYDGTAYPIDLQGNALRSLPDGTRDELRVGERKVLGKRVGSAVFDGSSDENWHVESLGVAGSNFYIAVSDAARGTYGDRIMLTLCQACTSNFAQKDRGFISNSGNLNLTVGGTLGISTVADFRTWLATNPVTVLYPLATPQEIDLGTITLPYVDGSAWVDAEVTPNIEATFRPVDFPDQPAIESVDVQRVNADGTAWTVAVGLPVGGSCIDPLPPLGVPVTYRATASAASGSTASSDFLKKFGGRSWVLNFGNAAQEFIEFSFSPETSNSLTHGGTGYHFADGGAGNGLPVFYPTTDRDISGTWKFNALGAAKSHQLKALLMKYPTAWLRDPFGERFRAHVNPSASHGSSNTWVISMDWEAERFREAWDG